MNKDTKRDFGCPICGHFRGPVPGCTCCAQGGAPQARPAPMSPRTCPSCADERADPGRRARQAGQALIEFALVLPVLLAMLLGTFEVGRVFLAQIQLQQATGTAADLVARGDAIFDWQATGLFAPACSVVVGSPDEYRVVEVTVTCPHRAIALPGGPFDRDLVAQAHAVLP